MPGDPIKGNTLFAGMRPLSPGAFGRRTRGAQIFPESNNKTKDELLTDILNPSYAIEPEIY